MEVNESTQLFHQQKLVAVREESEREKESLKRKISELDAQLEAMMDKQQSNAEQPAGGNQTGSKRRRFNFSQRR